MMRILIGLLVLTPVTALAGAHRFAADLAATPPDGRLMSSNLNWTCAGPRCEASGAMSDTPGRLCARLANDAGRVALFSVDGAPLDGSALAKCNARVRAAEVARN